MKKQTMYYLAGIILFVMIIVIIIIKPSDRGGPTGKYFAEVNEALLKAGIATPCIILDLDRVDDNLALMMKRIKPPIHYRISAKSVPSLDFIKYIMKKTGTSRLMVFHLPYLGIYLGNLSADTDLLLGKPMPIGALRAFYKEIPGERHADASRRIQWLLDTERGVREYLAFAREKGLKLRINVEIDVGLRRGGAPDTEVLGRMLKIIAAHPNELRFAGFMGYEGHVPFTPWVLFSKEDAIKRAFRASMERYRMFYDYGRKNFPALFAGDITLDSGGSKTYPYFTPDLPVNDITAGSCVVKPETFEDQTLAGHRPALFIAAPVIKIIAGAHTPFLEAVDGLIEWWDPNQGQSFYIYGGGWAGAIVSPPGMVENALTAGTPNENLLPSQSFLNGSKRIRIGIGDFVFFRPAQGDAIFQFETVVVMRGGKIVGTWKPVPRRY